MLPIITTSQPARALSYDGYEQRTRRSSVDVSHQDIVRIIQQSHKTPVQCLGEAELQDYAAFRSEIRNTLNHFQLSGIQVSLSDSQEAERERSGQRTQEHKKEMEVLYRMEKQQTAIGTQLDNIQDSIGSFSKLLESVARRMDQQDEDGRKEVTGMWKRLEQMERRQRDQIKILGDKIQTLVCSKRLFEASFRNPSLALGTSTTALSAQAPRSRSGTSKDSRQILNGGGR